MKILIAEDDAVSRHLLRRAVERLGHECLEARDGDEAWRLFVEHPEVSVVISDRMMPRMDGVELCRRIRGLERERYVFFIFLTSLGGKEHLLEGMEAGADEYLLKPLDVRQLEEKLAEAERAASLREHLDSEGRSDGGARPERVVRKRPGRRKGVWEVLSARGKVSEEQLQRALEVQRTERKELGKVLVSLGFVTESDLAQAQAERLGLDYVDLSEGEVDAGVSSLIDQKTLRRHGVMPLRIEDGRLVVAMSEPTNLHAIEDLRLISGYQVVPVVAAESQIRQVQNKVFSLGEGVSEILEDLAVGGGAEPEDELEIGAGSEDAPVIRLVNSILQRAVGEGASDVHVEPRPDRVAVRFRVDGVLREVMSIPAGLQGGVIARIKVLARLDIAERRLPQDGRFSASIGGQKVDLRVASLPTAYGEKVALRLLDTSSVETDLGKLGLTSEMLERYEGIYRRPYGTILVTGPTGSGKSTTLYATLRELNTPERNIITVEDPIEYRMPGINQVQVNPKAGLTFASGLRSILRGDPDVIMIGEIRDHETAKISVEAALTGHLVLATLHTNDAPGAVSRLTEMGVEPYLSASAVDCVIAQRLARRLCERCREPVEVEDGVLKELGFPFARAEGERTFFRARGCPRCGGTGYRGRIGIFEMMLLSEALRDLILHRASTAEIARVAAAEGMGTLREDGLLKAARGLTSIEEVLRTVV